jgi:hypothetical protein
MYVVDMLLDTNHGEDVIFHTDMDFMTSGHHFLSQILHFTHIFEGNKTG